MTARALHAGAAAPTQEPPSAREVGPKVACPHCGDRGSRVVDARGTRGGFRRVRRCDGCGRRYATAEVAVPSPTLERAWRRRG